jgi:hypothetical protein
MEASRMSKWQWRKSKNLLGGLIRLTGTRKGLGISVGGKGLRFSRSPTGRKHRTVSIPRTGLFKRKRIR